MQIYAKQAFSSYYTINNESTNIDNESISIDILFIRHTLNNINIYNINCKTCFE